jgi:hypothetical protein
MPTSYNGWAAGSRETANVVVQTVPGTDVTLPVNKDAADLLVWVAHQFDTRVETLSPEWCWGWANRTVRGSTTVTSNHASGTAIDLNAPKHPRGVAVRDTFTAAQVATVHAILAEVNKGQRMVDWGGDYRVSPPDGMHFELASHVTAADLRRTMLRLSGGDKPTGKPPTLWMRGPKRPAWTAYLQRLLKQHGEQVKVDGKFGPTTRAALVSYRRKHRIRPYRPGVAGPKVWKALGHRW